MSTIAEFAARVHGELPHASERELHPIEYPSRESELKDIRAVIFDVYGTLLHYWKPEFEKPEGKAGALFAAFRVTADHFGMSAALVSMNAEESPEKTLHDLYHGLIALNHDKSLNKGITFPEVRIEEVWMVILLMLKRHGYDATHLNLGNDREVAQCIAFFYNAHALGRRFYPGVVDALKTLKSKNMTLGIVSNAQFYTPMDLTLLIRDQSKGAYDDYLELFDPDLVIFSYEIGYAKPNPGIFRKLFDALYEFHILPSQTVFVGNDLVQDIQPAQEAGMKTAFFIGDDQSAFVHDASGTIIPDICFARWEELPFKIAFHGETKA